VLPSVIIFLVVHFIIQGKQGHFEVNTCLYSFNSYGGILENVSFTEYM